MFLCKSLNILPVPQHQSLTAEIFADQHISARPLGRSLFITGVNNILQRTGQRGRREDQGFLIGSSGGHRWPVHHVLCRDGHPRPAAGQHVGQNEAKAIHITLHTHLNAGLYGRSITWAGVKTCRKSMHTLSNLFSSAPLNHDNLKCHSSVRLIFEKIWRDNIGPKRCSNTEH